VDNERFITDENVTPNDGIDAESHGTGLTAPLLRFLPAVTFGLRTAALAGMVVSAGAVALGLTGVFDDSTNVAFTTCCGGFLPDSPVR
jgi:hypothetical protein